MSKSDGQRGGQITAGEAEDTAGALSALLGELARLPDGEMGGAWERTLRPGAVIGRFELVREIGRGGFGVVWEARDLALGRSVAFKAVKTGEKTSLREERLLREAEAAARLSHPNIVTLHDVGRCEQGPYLVLELLRGQTLADRMAQGPIPLHEALRIGAEIAAALGHAHRQGVVHRDLSAANVFLCEDGAVKVLDFGLAHAFGNRRAEGGTPTFMAPEQWRGAPEDERTDVFALGVILYRMLAGTLPFPLEDGGRAVTGPRPAPRLDTPGVPALGPLIARMLEKDPVDRPRDGAEVQTALAAFRGELERTPSGPHPPVRPRRSRRPAIAATVVGLVLASGVAVAVTVHLRSAALSTSAPEEGRITVAVADFENQTGEPELNGLSGMLITSLEQSRRLAVLTRVRMLDILRQLGRENVPGVDEALGREVARGAGARALVLASIRRFDRRYAIELKALDPATSEYLFTLKEVGDGKSSIPEMIDRLSEQTRARLRESPADVKASRVSVADATTASFEAYSQYFRGEQLKEATRYEPALDAYRQAIAADPSFALAHYQIAYLGEFTGLSAETRRAEIEAALREVGKVPEKERLLILAWKAHMDGDDAGAHALYARAVAAYPQDKETLYMAGDLHLHADEWATALPYFEKALALDPLWEPGLMHFTDCLAHLGRADELLARATSWVARAPSGSSYRALAMAEAVRGRFEGAVSAARRAFELDGGSSFSRVVVAESLNLAGRYGEAEALLRPLLEDREDKHHKHGFSTLAGSLAYQGRYQEALRVLDAAPPEPWASHGPDASRLMLLLGIDRRQAALAEAQKMAIAEKPWKWLPAVLTTLGDGERAAALAAKLPEGPERTFAEAAQAWRRGDRERALSLLRPLAREGSLDYRPPALWLIGQIALEAGHDAEAAAALESFRRLPGGMLRAATYARSLYLEALARERLGDRATARERIDELLAAWRHADPGQSLLAEARALRRRVA